MALAWVFERQQAEDAARASQLLATCGEEPWWVPGLWYLEVANALLVAERRGLIEPEPSDLFRARLAGLPISCDDDTAQERQSRLVVLAAATDSPATTPPISNSPSAWEPVWPASIAGSTKPPLRWGLHWFHKN